MKKHLFLAALILAVVQAGIGCRSKTDNNRDLIFVGIDALDWELMTPLLEQNLLPQFQKLIKMGASAKINTNEEGGSAVYWTSIATGQHADKHGIHGFVTTDPSTGQVVPYTSDMRKSKAFWNILGDAGLDVGIVGWYISWPAEPVNGFMLSSYLGMKEEDQLTWKGTIYAESPGMVYPESLQPDVDQIIRDTGKNYSDKLNLVVKPRALEEDSEIILSTREAFLSDEIYIEAGLRLLQKERPRVFAVYLSGLDSIGHRFTHADPGAQQNYDRKYGKVQQNYYRYMDRVLGLFMKEMRSNSLFVVVSDHGLREGEHTNDGVFICAGPGIRRGHRASEAINLTDVCPTLLYLLGFPVSADMDGRVFPGVAEPLYLEKNPIRFIPGYGQRENTVAVPQKSQFDEKIVERLKSLGYLK
ncbi:MAG: alkaline phosphatase family protein [Candidatus Aminicenantes bacterium]|nr:alkaline phosphatase family protein [Candidatus Aminicenantes bacterium]